MQQPVVQRQRLAECRTLGAESAAIGRVFGIARDLGAAASVRRGQDPAADAAIGTGRANHGSSVDIALVTAGPGQGVEPGLGAALLAALLGRDLQQRVLDVLGHAPGVAADIEVRALLQPTPPLGSVLAYTVLDVDLVGLIAREGEVEATQQAAALPVDDLVLVEEIGGSLLVAEEQPVASLGAARLAFLQEGTERRDAGAGANHDGGDGVISRRGEAVALLYEDRHHVAGLGEIGEVAGTDASALTLVAVPAHRRDREMDLARMGLGRGG